jgi:hypothetical protein
LADIIRFVRGVFGADETHRMFQPDVMRWKCFAPHPFWPGSRGYVLRYHGETAAFGCAVPCRLLTGAGTVASCDVIDWAASKAVPGAGLMLYRHIQTLAGTMINIGGTADARAVLPRIGFRVRAERLSFTRVLRPARHLQRAGRRDWKSPLRLARDYGELLRTRHGSGGLAARRIERFAGVAEDVFPDPAVTGQVVCARTAESLDYFLACPAAKTEAYLLEREGQAAGYFMLSRVGAQCRIADLWIRSSEAQLWAEAFAAATRAAGADARTTEVTAAVSLALQIAALRRAGYRSTDSEPVFVWDPGGMLGENGGLACGFLENDGFYWNIG